VEAWSLLERARGLATDGEFSACRQAYACLDEQLRRVTSGIATPELRQTWVQFVGALREERELVAAWEAECEELAAWGDAQAQVRTWGGGWGWGRSGITCAPSQRPELDLPATLTRT
jgi:hypothetical protein